MAKWLSLVLTLSLLIPISGQGPQSHDPDGNIALSYGQPIHPYAPGVNVTLSDGWKTVAKTRGFVLEEGRPPVLRVVCPPPKIQKFDNPPSRTLNITQPVLVFRAGRLTEDFAIEPDGRIKLNFDTGHVTILSWGK